MGALLVEGEEVDEERDRHEHGEDGPHQRSTDGHVSFLKRAGEPAGFRELPVGLASARPLQPGVLRNRKTVGENPGAYVLTAPQQGRP